MENLSYYPYRLFRRVLKISKPFRKKTEFILNKYKNELHILEGYLKCISNIDKVIEIIKKSKTLDMAKKSLVKEFLIDEVQAQAILDLRLRRLTSLEVNEIKKRKKELITEIKRLESIVASDKNLLNEIKKELTRIADNYSDKRRSKVQKNFKEIEAEKPVVEFYIAIKEKNIKTYQTRNFKFDGDILLKTNNFKDLILITQTGDFYKFSPEKIPAKVPLNIIGAFVSDFSEDDNRIVTIITRNGMIKRSYVSEYDVKRSQSVAIKLENNDEVVKVIISNNKEPLDVLLINDTFNYSYFNINEITPTGRNTKGVKAIRNKDDERILHVIVSSEVKEIVLVYSNENDCFYDKLSKSKQGDRKSIKESLKTIKTYKTYESIVR